MLQKVPVKFRKRSGRNTRRPITFGPPPVQPLVLVSVEYSSGDEFVRLNFDRDVDITHVVPSEITIDDGPGTGKLLGGTGAAHEPGVVNVALAVIGTSESAETTLTAGAGNGIVAADDGAAWAGVTDLVLPFP